MTRFTWFTAAAGGLFLVATGVWAMVGPQSFFDTLATFPPYNRHLLHDIGAFLVGLGAALLLGLRVTRALALALTANAVAGVLHAVSHIVDRDLGGKASDPVLFTVIALVLVAASAAALKEDNTDARTDRGRAQRTG